MCNIHGKLVQHGFRFAAKHIIGAIPSHNQARNTSSTPIKVTYNSPRTKQEVTRAAIAANIWNRRQPKEGDREEGRRGYFKEVPPKRQNQVKRKIPELTTGQPAKRIKNTEEEKRRQEIASLQQMPTLSGDELTLSETECSPKQSDDLGNKPNKSRQIREAENREEDGLNMGEILKQSKLDSERQNSQLRWQRSLIEAVEAAPPNQWFKPASGEQDIALSWNVMEAYWNKLSKEAHEAKEPEEQVHEACLSSNSADLDKTYESCSPNCDNPCQIHLNPDETGSDDNDDTTKNE